MPTNTLSSMKQIFRIVDGIIRYWWVVLLAVVLLCLVGCKTQYVPVETVKIQETEKLKVQRDSIYVHDSIYIYMQGDTVHDLRWKTIYKEIFRTDTFLVNKTDTINNVVEIEKPLTKIQELKMDIGAGVMWAVPIILVLYFVYRKLRP